MALGCSAYQVANQSMTTSLFCALCASMNVLYSASDPIDLYVEAKRAEAAERRASSSAEGRERDANIVVVLRPAGSRPGWLPARRTKTLAWAPDLSSDASDYA